MIDKDLIDILALMAILAKDVEQLAEKQNKTNEKLIQLIDNILPEKYKKELKDH